jgi:hypothetical protein
MQLRNEFALPTARSACFALRKGVHLEHITVSRNSSVRLLLVQLTTVSFLGQPLLSAVEKRFLMSAGLSLMQPLDL